MNTDYQSHLKSFNEIYKLNEFSTKKLKCIRNELESFIDTHDFKNDICIVTTGSFGRAEASEESDMDFFIICNSDDDRKSILEKSKLIGDIITKYVPKNTGSTGTFGENAINTIQEITSNIGGLNDSNQLLTRRMLFILEGACLYNIEKFKEYKGRLIDKYLEPTNGEYLDRYLLNDIIRYYRTIATDFQFKVDESEKEWGLRNIKLKFSRKILYYSGILSVIHTYLSYLGNDNNSKTKKEILLSIVDEPVMERIYNILQKYNQSSELNDDIHTTFMYYNVFLETISNNEKRKELEKTTKDGRNNNDTYKTLNKHSQSFTKRLYSLTTKIAQRQGDVLESLIF